MPMSCETAETLCDAMARSASEARYGLAFLEIEEVLDRLWDLQDHLNRLVDVLSDRPAELGRGSDGQYQRLRKEIGDVLAHVRTGAWSWNPGTNSCCREIEGLLAKLDMYRVPELARTASA